MEEGIFKGGTLIIVLDSIKMIGSDYVFKENDKVLIALKKINTDKNALYAEITPTAGETKTTCTFSSQETDEKLTVGAKYKLQADLVTSEGKVFPMILHELKVIDRAIVSPKAGE